MKIMADGNAFRNTFGFQQSLLLITVRMVLLDQLVCRFSFFHIRFHSPYCCLSLFSLAIEHHLPPEYFPTLL